MIAKIQSLCKGKKITIAELERELDFANGSIRRWNIKTPGIDKVQAVADYFNVSVDYLLGRVDDPDSYIWEKNLPQKLLDADIDGVMVSGKLMKYINESGLTEDQIIKMIELFKSWNTEVQG